MQTSEAGARKLEGRTGRLDPRPKFPFDRSTVYLRSEIFLGKLMVPGCASASGDDAHLGNGGVHGGLRGLGRFAAPLLHVRHLLAPQLHAERVSAGVRAFTRLHTMGWRVVRGATEAEPPDT